jgi:serine phosphatase RsbU (regulator of sigma subunit)
MQELENVNANLEKRVVERTNELMSTKAENMRMSAELEVTHQLQHMLLPREEELLQVKGLDIAGFMEPADEVGGDYYDVLTYDGRTIIGIGDVTGHGLESSVIMLMAQMAVRTLAVSKELDPVKYLNILNRTIYDNVQRMGSHKNMTLALLEYDAGNLKLYGQHEEMIVVRKETGTLERIDTIDLGFPIGLQDDISGFIHTHKIQLAPGDVAVLFTDGIPEAENSRKEYYQVERLCEVIKANFTRPVNEIRQAVVDDVRRHIGDHTVYDDITLVVLKQQ